MNVGLVEEAAFQLDYEKQYIVAHELIKCRCDSPDGSHNTTDCVKLRIVLESVVKINKLLQEAIHAADPKTKKFWQFWKK